MSRLNVKSTALVLLASALTVAATGCSEPAPPTPRPLGVSPDRGSASRPVAVTIRGRDLAASASTDFGGQSPSTLDARFQASLGAVSLRDVRLQPDGTLTATVPEGIPVGLHDLTVVSPEGRAGKLAAAYEALADADAVGLVAGYRFEPIGAQVAWAPFAVTITAVDAGGATVEAFNGEVTLTDLAGALVPGTAALFRDGVWSGLVEIRAPFAADVLHAADALGHAGDSAPFAVAPAPPGAFRFVTSARSAAAGACSGPTQPITVELTDAFGVPTIAASDLPISAVGGPGLTLFADDGCATALAAPAVAAGSGAVTFWFRGTVTGNPVVALSAGAMGAAAQAQTVTPGPPSKLAFVTAPQTVAAGECSQPATVELRDAWENPVTGTTRTLTLSSAPSTGFELFADSGCAATASTVTSSAVDARADVWFRGTTAQSVTVTASGTAIAAASQAVTVNSEANPSRLSFLTPPRTATAGTCSGAVTVAAQDSFGNPVAVAAPLTVALLANPAAGFAFFSDAACTAPAGGVATLSAGQSAATVYFRGTAAAAETVSASAGGLTGASQEEQVVAAGPAALAFTSAPQSVAAGTCSEVATLQLRDAFDNAAVAVAPAAVALAAGAPTLALYSDDACTAPVASVTVATGAGGAGFYFKGTATGAFTVAASASGLAGAIQVETVTAATADRLRFETGGQAVTAGLCSGVVTIQSRDAFENAASVQAATPVSLSAAPGSGFAFYSDAGCTSAVSSVTIAPSTSQADFYFRGEEAGSVTVTADGTAAGLTAPAQDETIAAAAAHHLVFTTPPQTVTAGLCSSAVTVESRDAFENAAPVGAATPVPLSALPGAGFALYSDPGCTSAVSSITIAASASQASFYFRGEKAGAVTVTADGTASGLTAPTQDATITAAAAHHLVFTTPPQTVTAGGCSAVATVQSRDAFENVAALSSAATVSLSALPGAGFALYSDATCTSAVSSVTIAPSDSQAGFHFVGEKAGNVEVTAGAAGLGTATQTEIVLPANADRLVFLTDSRTATAGVCSDVLTVEAQDPFGNPVSAAAPIPLTLSPATGTVFYGDAGCSTPLGAGEPAIVAGSSGASLHFKGTVAGSFSLTVSASGLTAAAQDEAVTAASADSLAFTSPAQTVTAGACSASTDLELRDAFGNPAIAAADVTVSLAASSTGLHFFTDPGCLGAPVSSIAVASGTGSGGFWFKGTEAVAVTVDATAPLLGPASQEETIVPAPVTHLDFTTAAQTVSAGLCSAGVTVESQDEFHNPSPVGATATLTLSASPDTGVQLHAGTGCAGGAVTSLPLASGASSVTLSFASTSAGSFTLGASAPGMLPDPSQSETITPAAPDALEFTTPAQTVTAGQCALASVRALDPFGNPSSVTATTQIDLAADPVTGFAFYSDSGCTAVVTSASIAAAAGSASFHFRGTVAGAVSVAASVVGWTTPASQEETVVPGTAATLRWDPVLTPVAADSAFDVRITALDAFDNVATGFAGTADLSIVVDPPAGPAPLTCSAGCTGLTTAPFSAGGWTGTVAVGEPESPSIGTPDRRLVATSGTVTGNSNDFAVYGEPDRSPPTARLTASPAVVLAPANVVLDASGSTDYQTPTSELRYAFDLTGAATAEPDLVDPTPGGWTAWSTAPSENVAFATYGTYTARVAVRDTDDDIGYGVVSIRVRGLAAFICWVGTDADTDDAPSSCADAANHGDGLLSLREAARVAPAGNVIAFESAALPMTIVNNPLLGAISIANPVEIRGPGVVLEGLSLTVNGGDSATPTLFVGLELDSSSVNVANARAATFRDVWFRNGAGITSSGWVTLDRARLTDCAGACVSMLDHSDQDTLTATFSEFRGGPSSTKAIDVTACDTDDLVVLARSTLFTGFDTAIDVRCDGRTTIQHDTFEANAVGIAYAEPIAPGGHDIRNSIFSNNATAVTCGTSTLAPVPDYDLLWQNTSNGCVGAGPNDLAEDPLYLYPSQGDYRLALLPAKSPAVDSGVTIAGIPLLPGYTTLAPPYLGVGPDRGAFETW